MTRVLIVEDDDDLRFLYETAFAREGFEVVTAPSTVEAMLHLTNQDFDAIILDLNMPDVPGQKVIAFTREDVRLRNVPIVVVSANEAWRAEVDAMGVREFMVKPVQIQHLVACVDELLRT